MPTWCRLRSTCAPNAARPCALQDAAIGPVEPIASARKHIAAGDLTITIFCNRPVSESAFIAIESDRKCVPFPHAYAHDTRTDSVMSVRRPFDAGTSTATFSGIRTRLCTYARGCAPVSSGDVANRSRTIHHLWGDAMAFTRTTIGQKGQHKKPATASSAKLASNTFPTLILITPDRATSR